MLEQLNTPGRWALNKNLGPNQDIAFQVDDAVKIARPNNWAGMQACDRATKAVSYVVLQEADWAERVFLIIYHQQQYLWQRQLIWAASKRESGISYLILMDR